MECTAAAGLQAVHHHQPPISHVTCQHSRTQIPVPVTVCPCLQTHQTHQHNAARLPQSSQSAPAPLDTRRHQLMRRSTSPSSVPGSRRTRSWHPFALQYAVCQPGSGPMQQFKHLCQGTASKPANEPREPVCHTIAASVCTQQQLLPSQTTTSSATTASSNNNTTPSPPLHKAQPAGVQAAAYLSTLPAPQNKHTPTPVNAFTTDTRTCPHHPFSPSTVSHTTRPAGTHSQAQPAVSSSSSPSEHHATQAAAKPTTGSLWRQQGHCSMWHAASSLPLPQHQPAAQLSW